MLLKRPYSFWLQAAKSDRHNYDDNLIHLALVPFSSVAEFWRYYQYLCRPSQLVEGSQFLIFQQGIKPKWEDEANANGGRFLYRLKYSIDRVWEDLILNYIGEQCLLNDLICGVIVHQKKNFTLISLWVRRCEVQQRDRLHDWIMDTLHIGDRSELEYQDHPKIEDRV